MTSTKYSRRHDLDWLRVLAFSLLILFHTGMMFNTWGWHVKNTETSVVFEWVMIFLSQWRMPLLFFISGAAIWFAMEKYNSGRFAYERFKRLGIPLLFGMLVIIPPQVCYERLFQGQEFNSFWHFYQTLGEFKPYPDGNMSWHHLWYIPYILVYSLLMLPFFAYFKTVPGRSRLSSWMNTFSNGKLVFLGFLPIAFTEVTLRPFWPDNAGNLVEDWAQFASTLFIFICGFGFASSKSIWSNLEKNRYRLLHLAAVCTVLLYLSWYTDLESPIAPTIIYRIVRSANIWFWILTILGFGSKYLRFSHPLLDYANQAVYPFYILHQTITVIVGFYLVDWAVGIPLKFPVVALATFLGSWLLYEFPIRRLNLTRPLFGLKLQRKDVVVGAPCPDYSSLNSQQA